MNDELPVHVGHYLQDLGPEGGQGVMRLFIDPSLKFAPHRRIKRITIWLAGRPDFLRPVVFFRLAFCQAGDFSCVGAQSFSHTFKEFGALPAYFLAKDGLLHKIILEMVSFPMSVANNCYD
jgi:hypothetical protein